MLLFYLIISCSKFEPHASKRRAESECESTKSGQPSGSMTPEALQLKEFKQKVKSLGIELRDAKAREVKLRKENERYLQLLINFVRIARSTTCDLN